MNYFYIFIIIVIVIIFLIFSFSKKIIEKYAFLPQFAGKYNENIKGFQWVDKIPTVTITPENDKYPDFIILYSHGNAENIGDILDTLTELSNFLNIKIFAYDYPGYGLSKGIPSEKGCYENIRKCYHYLTEKYMPTHIINMGRSIGTGSATYLSANFETGLLILISPFTSVVSVVSPKLTFLGDIFPNEKNITKVKAKICIIHGVNDSLIPHSEMLWSILSYYDKVYFGKINCDHNDILNTKEGLENISIGLHKYLV